MTKLKAQHPSLFFSLIPIIFLILLLVINISLFQDSATSGPNQVALFLSAVVAAIIGLVKYNVQYKDIEKSIIHSLMLSMQANLILLVVGMLIGLWILSGTVPMMIYLGVKIIHPTWFLPISALTCAIVSITTGSSWSTGGTLGVALMGIGSVLNIPPGMVAGAVISGAYFGDKLSPLSDTTNLAPVIAGTDLFTHIKYMLFTTVPSFILALIGFTIIGLTLDTQSSVTLKLDELEMFLNKGFKLSYWLLTLPLLVFVLVSRKIPALPVLIIAAILGGVYALVFQPEQFINPASSVYEWKYVYQKLMEVSFGGYKSELGSEMVDKLLSRGGMVNMLNTIWLIFMAMVFGGVMECTGFLSSIAEALLKMVVGVASLIGATLATALFINLTAADQYLAIVIPGKMFKKAYKKYNLAPENLSRSLEDAGTITSVLVPWNTCGAYFSTVLGVSHALFIPFCIFNLINPLISVLIASFNWKIKKLSEESITE